MTLLDAVVLPVFGASGVPVLQAPTIPYQVVVPCVLDAPSGTRTFVRVIADEDDATLKLWSDICAVPPARRGAMLELTNRLNTELRWLKFSVTHDMAVLEVDLALGDSGHPCDQFQAAFAGYMQVLHLHWADVVRLATRRGRRSRLEREVEGLLSDHTLSAGD